MDKASLITLLFKLGWTAFESLSEAIAKTTGPQLDWLQKLYAAFHGLSEPQAIETHLQKPRMCNLPELMQVKGYLPKWPKLDLTWTVLNTVPGLNPADCLQAAETAWRRWAEVCGIRPRYSPNDRTANVLMDVRFIDGQFGVLGESELPIEGVKQLHQWFDTGDRWSIFDGPGQGLDLCRVMCHEIGHVIGMNHIGAGNLLAPVYNPNVWLPQAGDIQEVVARYGSPDEKDPAPASSAIIIRINNGVPSIDGYRVLKLQVA